ncbi:MAG TPA: spore coat U domain-containing protein [bacterium]|nr:spore coat U domain-containing protein [bacterium]
MKSIKVAIVTLFVVWAAPVWAQGTCSVSASGLQFGSSGGGPQETIDTTGTVTVVCSAGTPYQVLLGAGSYADGAFQRRRLRGTSGNYYLAYNVYIDSARNIVWGDGTNNTAVLSGMGSGAPTSFQVFGRIPPGQNVPAGVYQDLLAITLVW